MRAERASTTGASALCLGVLTDREIGQTDDTPARCRKRMLRDLTIPMQVFIASLQFQLAHIGDDEPLTNRRKLLLYMANAWTAGGDHMESLWLVCMNPKRRPISRTCLRTGPLSAATVRPRDVFRVAILAETRAIALVRLQPGETAQANPADQRLAHALREVCPHMDTEFVDFVIVAANGIQITSAWTVA